MKKYFINEQETFAVNEEVTARVELMGWQEFPIVYIDNFYKNPDKVRNLHLDAHRQTTLEFVENHLELG